MNHIVLMAIPEQRVKSVEEAEVVSVKVGLSGFWRGPLSSEVRDRRAHGQRSWLQKQVSRAGSHPFVSSHNTLSLVSQDMHLGREPASWVMAH